MRIFLNAYPWQLGQNKGIKLKYNGYKPLKPEKQAENI